MKKIVSIFIALFVFIGMNAQSVSFSYTEFTNQITTTKGKSSLTVNKDGISVTIKDTYKNARTSTYGLYKVGETLAARGSSSAVLTLTVSLNSSDEDSKRIIKNVIVNTTTGDVFAAGVVNDNLNSNLTVVNDEGSITIDNDFDNCVDISYQKGITSEVRINSIIVVCGELWDNVTLSDDNDYPFEGRTIYAKNVTYTRSMGTNHWGTLCLPYAYTLSDNNFAGYYTHSMSNIADGFATVKKYANGERISAGLPILFYTNNSEIVVTAKNVALSTDLFTDGIRTVARLADQGQKFIICGNLNKVRYENEYLYYVSKDKLIYCAGNANVNVKPYRAFIRPDNSRSSRRYANVRSLAFNVLDEDDNVIDNFSFADNDDVTAVESAETDTEENIIGIFTADGKKVNEYQKGLNIVKTTNGVKKVYIR